MNPTSNRMRRLARAHQRAQYNYVLRVTQDPVLALRVLETLESPLNATPANRLEALVAARNTARDVMGVVRFARSPFVRGGWKCTRLLREVTSLTLGRLRSALEEPDPEDDEIDQAVADLPGPIRGVVELALVEGLRADQVALLLDSSIEDVIAVISGLVERILDEGAKTSGLTGMDRGSGIDRATRRQILAFEVFDVVGRRLLFTANRAPDHPRTAPGSVDRVSDIQEHGRGPEQPGASRVEATGASRCPAGPADTGEATATAAFTRAIRAHTRDLLDRLGQDRRAVPLGSTRPGPRRRSVGSFSRRRRRGGLRALLAGGIVAGVLAVLVSPFVDESAVSPIAVRATVFVRDAVAARIASWASTRFTGRPGSGFGDPRDRPRELRAGGTPRLLTLGEADRVWLAAHSTLVGTPGALDLLAGTVAIRAESGTPRVLTAGPLRVHATDSRFAVRQRAGRSWVLEVGHGRIDVTVADRHLALVAGQVLHAGQDGIRIL